MKTFIYLFLFLLIPIFNIAQEINTTPFFQNTSKNNRTTYLDRVNNPIKKRFESLTKFLRLDINSNYQTAEKSILKQKLDSTFSSFVNFPELKDKHYFTYNQAGQQLLSFSTSWDETAQTYYYQSKSEWSYDAKGNLAESIFYTGDALIWEKSTKTEFNYNSNDQLITVINYNWNSTTNIWELIFKTEIAYDLNGIASLVQFFDWNATNNQWMLNGKTELQYDTKGNLLEQTFYSWDQQWLFLAREEFTYNSFNQELSFVSLYWDDVVADWINDHKWTSEYNMNQQLIIYSEFSWDDAISQWIPIDKIDYTYDMNGNMTSFIDYNRDQQNQQWISFFRGDCTYNNQYTFNDLVLPNSTGVENDIYFNHMLTKVGYFEYNAGNWYNSDNVLYYYSGINITKTNNLSNSEIQIAPNPANDYFNILTNEVNELNFRLFDLNGRQIISKKGFANESISTEHLSKGMYCYKIILDDKTVNTGKLIIE